MLNPYLDTLHFERYLLNSWPQSGLVMHVNACRPVDWSSERSQRELSCCNGDSVEFNDILYIWKTHTVCHPAAVLCSLEWSRNHHFISLTHWHSLEMFEVANFLLGGFTATSLWIQHRFYKNSSNTVISVICWRVFAVLFGGTRY